MYMCECVYNYACLYSFDLYELRRVAWETC